MHNNFAMVSTTRILRGKFWRYNVRHNIRKENGKSALLGAFSPSFGGANASHSSSHK